MIKSMPSWLESLRHRVSHRPHPSSAGLFPGGCTERTPFVIAAKLSCTGRDSLRASRRHHEQMLLFLVNPWMSHALSVMPCVPTVRLRCKCRGYLVPAFATQPLPFEGSSTPQLPRAFGVPLFERSLSVAKERSGRNVCPSN